MIYAQTVIECSDQKSTKDDCCTNKKSTSCHTETSTDNSTNNNCSDDCTQCHSCTVNFVMNYLSPEISSTDQNHFFLQEINFEYGISYFSSSFQNIWQPPKVG